MTAVVYVNKLGRCSMALNKTTCKILKWCKQHNTQLSAQHLPGLNNSRANCLSHLYPQHEWWLADHIKKHTQEGDDLYRDRLTVSIFKCSEAALCPVHTFQHWSEQTTSTQEHTTATSSSNSSTHLTASNLTAVLRF
jgi:predicted membrane channel-forming protein YqfA (hemolysin III family)